MWKPIQTTLVGALAAVASVIVFGSFASTNGSADPRGAQSALSREGDAWVLKGPDSRRARVGPAVKPQRSSRASLLALAYHYDTRVFPAPDEREKPTGVVRRGTVLSVKKRVSGKGCRKGEWYALSPTGYACTQQGFLVAPKPREFWIRQPRPALNAGLPYRYARVITPGALRLHRLPAEKELDDLAAKRRAAAKSKSKSKSGLPDFVQDVMVGDYFVAVDRIEKVKGKSFYRTVRGRYVGVEDLELRDAPKMHGVVLAGTDSLPYGFVHSEDAPLLELRDGKPRKAGRAERHARFRVRGKPPAARPSLVPGPKGLYLPREHVRIARRIARPKGVDKRARWVHVDLTEQTLVAYEGDKPVFATLVSTGKEKTHATPTGLFRVRDKHVSVTMRGDDPIDGYYEVSEVPWTQFYHGAYALHGAYWHDTFGNTRSHGCINVSPPDGRWLFHWTAPDVPDSFHAVRYAEGTQIYIDRSKG